MKQFDINGLRLAEYQGQLFEKSVERFPCSTRIFLRRFLHSGLLQTLDKNEFSLISQGVDEALTDLENEFGKTNYGKVQYPSEILFWMGYLYRYLSYTRDTSTPLLLKWFPPEKLQDVYVAYHTQDPEWCIRNLLEERDLTEDIFDKNWRLKQVMKEKLACSF